MRLVQSLEEMGTKIGVSQKYTDGLKPYVKTDGETEKMSQGQ